MTTIPNPVDYLKYVAAEGKHLLEAVEFASACLAGEGPEGECELEWVSGIIDKVKRMLIEAAATFCRDGGDMDTYADGRRVSSSLELEAGNIFEYRWHPYGDHRDNRPHTLLDRYEGTSGARHSVIVAADQVLDVVHHGRGLRLVDE